MTSNNETPAADQQKPAKYFDIAVGRPVGVSDPTADMLIKAYLGSFNAAAEQGANSQACVAFGVVQVALLTIQLLIEQGAVEVKNA